MSKNIKTSIYVAISIAVLILLFISFVSIKASFGGINLNFYEKNISDKLKLDDSFESNLENIVLKRSNEMGFYLEIEKLQIVGANGLALETNLISWDFNLLNLITFSMDEKNKILSEKINISNDDFQIFIDNFNLEFDEFDRVLVSCKKIDLKSKHYTLNFQSVDNNILFDTNSIFELFDTKSSITSDLSINNENFQTNFEIIPSNQQINILKFSGDYFYMNETSNIQYNTKYKIINTKLDINSKKNSLINILNLSNESKLYSFINGFKGWQSILLETNFNYDNEDIISSLIKNMYLNISGIYELNTLMPNDKFYQNFGDVTKYDIELYNDKEKYVIDINHFKNDQLILNKGSFFKLNYGLNNANINLVTSIHKDAAINYLQNTLLSRETRTDRVSSFLQQNLNENNDITLNFNIDPTSNNIIESLKNLYVASSGELNTNFIFDDNENPNFISGPVNYYIEIENLETQSPLLKGLINLSETTAYIRQINLNKNNKTSLKIQFEGDTNVINDSLIIFDSLDSEIDFSGKIKITKSNHIFLEELSINNNSNVKLNLSGDLSERVLNLNITGSIIDLSANKVETKKKEREYYLNEENYSINTDEVIFAGSVRVNDFKAGIEKQGSMLTVNSRAFFMGHELNYSREKNDNVDVNIINSSDITHFVNNNHPAKKLLSDGEFKMTSIRNLNTQEADVKINLNDFVLINTPASLKLLSLPSISGLVSIAEGEDGIRFGYGEINYIETENKFNEIEAFAVSDSLGLIMDGNIDRKEKIIEMKGEISPMHLVNAIIQKLPILGPIIVGGEGEGMFSIDFLMKGSSEDPEVESNPLTIIKPRIIERAIEAIENGSTIQSSL